MGAMVDVTMGAVAKTAPFDVVSATNFGGGGAMSSMAPMAEVVVDAAADDATDDVAVVVVMGGCSNRDFRKWVRGCA